jgi:hypothetical protein
MCIADRYPMMSEANIRVLWIISGQEFGWRFAFRLRTQH